MGRERRRVEITASVSRHNSPRDARDDALWDLLVAEIRILVEDERFILISVEVNS